MQIAKSGKLGYTLVEVLVVVSIIGILSSMGVVGLQRAVANARIKDAAVNTAAFLEQVANKSNRMGSLLCVVQAPGNAQKLLVYKAPNTDNCGGTLVDSLVLDAPNQFVSAATCGLPTNIPDWRVSTDADNRFFKPRVGLSAAPFEGGVCIQYGSRDLFGAAYKEKKSNRIKPQWKIGNDVTTNGGDWIDL